jgi:3-deoxy-manno-octulosonate cytidylyltransferase (CMP-KDO synthetase)
MSHDFHVIIPARLGSTRLPGKLLLEVHGRTILEYVYQQALQSKPASITIASDDVQIFDLAKSFGADVLMTDINHQSGTDRVAEAARILGLDADAKIVNLQGDEPQMPPELIQQVAKLLDIAENDWGSLYWPIENPDDWHNPNMVKLVMNHQEHALYFSRSPIPYHRQDPKKLVTAYRHIGLYAYRHASLQAFVNAPMSPLEQLECLEQLRALSLGMRIQMQKAWVIPGQDINTSADFECFAALALMR